MVRHDVLFATKSADPNPLGALYSDFKSQADYELVRNYANELSVVIWDSPAKRVFFVSKAGHEQVRSFVKRRIDSAR